MALVVGENTYVTILEAQEIADNDFIIERLNLPESKLEISLKNATSIFDTMFKFKCSKTDEVQLLEFPRTCKDESVIDINDDIKLITTRLCYFLESEPEMFTGRNSSTTDQQIKKEKMDIFETEYFEFKGNPTVALIDKLDMHTRALIEKYIIGDVSSSKFSFEYRTLS